MQRFLSVLMFAWIFLFTALSHAANRVEFILDVSGSMNALSGGEKRIDAARKAIAGTLTSIPEGSIVALRLYGHRVPQTNKAESCKDSQLVVPFGPINKQQIQGLVNQALPLGQTPIAYSLEQAANDFGPPSDEQPVIILVSDGEESCGGDPVAVAKALIARGFKVKIHTIGLDVDSAARAQLEAISTATGGSYKDAKDAAGLTSSLQQLTQESLLVQKEKSVYGDTLRGGDSYETAVALPSGKLFRLDHHQKKDQYDYFYVDAKAGQKIIATIETGETGVRIQGDQVFTDVSPYAGIAVHNAQRQKIKDEVIIGQRNSKKSIEVPIPAGGEGRYYLLIGNLYDAQHKDQRFQVDLPSQFDANTDRDAGAIDAAALEIVPGVYEKNFIGGNDTADVFKLNVAAGTSYEIKARPENSTSSLEITVVDADGVELGQARSPNEGAAVILPSVKANKPSAIFIRITPWIFKERETNYVLSITPGGTVASPTAEISTPASPPSVSTAPSVPSKISPTQGFELGQVLTGRSFLEQAKIILIYAVAPGLVIFLIGLLWGYIWGRRSGKRKTLAQMK